MENKCELQKNLNKNELDELITKFICGCNIPIEVVDSDFFTDLIKFLCPDYLPPDSKSITIKLFQSILNQNCIGTGGDHKGTSDGSFTSDQFEASSNIAGPSEDTSSSLLQTVASKNSIETKKALAMLNDLYPLRRFEYFENSQDVNSRYKIVLTIEDDKFVGIGPSKTSAKHRAAAAAVTKWLGESGNKSETCPMSPRRNFTVEQQQLADHVQRLVLEKFNDVMKTDPFLARTMVLSGIVMTRGSDLCNSETIAISTGTKCVSDEYMSMLGTSLNDLHAEIVARRCLLVYLYSQLKLRLKNLTADNDSVFEASVNPGKLKLKQHIQFHLYISSAPCGDARLFTVDNDIEDIALHPPRRISRGKLRTKTISGYNTTPAKFNVKQTWEGVLQGETLLTMACSDKIMRWNVLGLQGSLLSYFVDPIYLKSIILGCPFEKSHLYRTVRGRIENTVQELPAPYYLNCPQLLYSIPSDISHLGKDLEFSVNWINGCPDVEIINTNTGKPKNGLSRLCKRNLMKRFLDICTELRDYSRYSGNLTLFYDEVKQLSNYNIAKQQLMKAFPKAGLGTWVHKPIEQQQFALVFK